MTHVPDDVLNSIDRFGQQLLEGSPTPVDGRLRGDLRLTIIPDDNRQIATLRYETEHTQAPPTLRERGSFVTTIVDGVDSHLSLWGIVPPDSYEHVDTTGGTHTYSGTLELA
jgi:hypothetical protein